ncbi:MAG TPA: DmsE family decaheme c-type cytochrome [Pyrinomonadaceae bacterium]|jgi:predicted CXXCH cytochrome family protein|nr:DmsE family decaheme c-type cytochrome [Pyrinomonadaceae bacterium]
MPSTKKIKIAFLTIFSFLIAGWAFSGNMTGVRGDTVVDAATTVAPEAAATPGGDYVGSEACQACHEDQFKNFTPTKHAKLKEVASWKNKVVGCESCHGPGKAHLEDATDLTKIISFKGMTSKQTSESCLACHSGKESHNNFRRGEHWRNDVGCTDCHSPHGSPLKDTQAGSITFPGETSKQNAGIATVALLKQSEPQLCMSCHTETKSQFSKPFHHKVMEGTMTCSSCHNAHGGFEAKQAKLAVGADASCVKCHSNKQGPFAFEHAPLKTEGCAACHTPHGSSNAKMLTRSTVRQMCLECHSAITDQIETPGVPTFHNQTTVRYQNCTVCHTAIHGSNSSNRFLRP